VSVSPARERRRALLALLRGRRCDSFAEHLPLCAPEQQCPTVLRATAGEAFGGFFGKADAAAGGQYLLQAAAYRIYRIDGLDTVTRSNGSFVVTPAKLVLAQGEVNARLQAEAAASGTAVATTVTVPYIASVSVAAKDRDFPVPFAASWNRAAAKAKLAYDESHLYVHWYVEDSSPWVNGGLDWQMMFKTGDCVDIQLGMLPAPAALPSRPSPVVGDVRLLIAPLQGTNIAVLYRNRAAAGPGTPLQPVTFVSPWRAETVDDVRRLFNVTIVVAKKASSYTVTASIPLSDIFWPGALPASGGIRGVRKLDIGALYGDFGGTMIALRAYWANKATGLVNDVPGEVMLSPNMWGDLRFGSPPGSSLSIAFAGVLANSGESGQAIVHVGPQLGSFNSLGVVVDRYGFLWDRAGSGRLNRLSQDGRLSASYPIAAGSRMTDRLSIVDGELLVLNVMGYFYALNVTAPAGTAPKLLSPTAWYSSYLSPGSYGGRVAVLTQRARLDNFTLAWLNPRNGFMEPLLQLPSVIQSGVYVEVLPHNGSILVLEQPTVDVESWVVAPNGTILRTFRGIGRQQWCDGYLWSFNYHSSVFRFSAQTYTADPGVVLGGNSGSFIGELQQGVRACTEEQRCLSAVPACRSPSRIHLSTLATDILRNRCFPPVRRPYAREHGGQPANGHCSPREWPVCCEQLGRHNAHRAVGCAAEHTRPRPAPRRHLCHTRPCA
jgi:hypothetical protein